MKKRKNVVEETEGNRVKRGRISPNKIKPKKKNVTRNKSKKNNNQKRKKFNPLHNASNSQTEFQLISLNGFSKRFYTSFIEPVEEINSKFLEFREIYSEKNSNLQFDDIKLAFKLVESKTGKEKYFKGLTKLLDSKFGSPYGYKQNHKNNFSMAFDDGELNAVVQMDNAMSVAAQYLDEKFIGCQCDDLPAIQHGSLVDDELFFYTEYNVKRSELHNCTNRLLNYLLIEKQTVPIQCQLSIYNPSRKIATSVDLICFNVAEQKFKLFEIKTSHSSIFESEQYEKKFHKFIDLGEGGKFPHTQYMHHQIQLLMLKSIFNRRYVPKGMKFDYNLVRICSDGIKVYNEHKFTTDQKKRITNILRNTKQQQQQHFKKRN